MGTQLGYTKQSVNSDPNWDKSGETTNIVVVEYVLKHSGDPSASRTIWLIQQGGGFDDNQATTATFTLADGWTSVPTIVDGSLTDMKDFLSADCPDIGVYLSMSDAEVTAIFESMLS